MIQRGIYAQTKAEAISRAKEIARQEGISGRLTVTQKQDVSGGYYWEAKWV